MLRKLIFTLLPIILFGAACAGGGSGPATKATPRIGTSVRDANGDGIYDSSRPADVSSGTPAVRPPATATSFAPPVDAAIPTDSGSASTHTGGASLFGALSPLDLLDTSAGDSSADVDPSLRNSLIGLGDLPNGFTSSGDFARSASTELGDMSYVVNVFSTGDLESGDFGTVVASAAMTLSPEAFAEFNRQGGMNSLDNFTTELQALQAEAAQLGVIYSDIRALDGAGLGDGGGGVHFVLDMSGLLDAFGTPPDNTLAGALSSDMYIFLRGNHVFMLIVMWHGNGSSGVDSHHLASLIDTKAAAAGF